MRKIDCYKWQKPWNPFNPSWTVFCGALIFVLLLSGCAKKPERPYYSRTKGGYLHPTVDKKPAPAPKPQSITRTKKQSEERAPNNELAMVTTPPVVQKSEPALKEVADSYLGVPYRWAGQSRKGMDCSGFIRTVYKQVYQLSLPHSSKKLGKMGEPVSRSELKRGDIVLFGSVFGIHHAGIYMQGDEFIHSSTSRGVIYSSLNEDYYHSKYKGARRIF